MSGNQNGDAMSMNSGETGETQQGGYETGNQTGNTGMVRRSASPAKRSAADMEGVEHGIQEARSPLENELTDSENNLQMSVTHKENIATGSPARPSLDDQVQRVTQLSSTSIEDGEKGYLLSFSWFSKIYARAPSTAEQQEWPKAALEGDIGPVDNTDIVAHGAFNGQQLYFRDTELPYIALRPGLERGTGFEIVTEAAWNQVTQWYGLVEGQLPVVRFAKDTAPDGATSSHIQYEINPPVFTIRKMLSGRGARPPTPPATANTSQLSTASQTPETTMNDLAVQVVASRQDRFQAFLAHSKRAAGIPMEHKVRPLRQLNSSRILTDQPNIVERGILTPETSRSSSPNAGHSDAHGLPKLTLDSAAFAKMIEGVDYEMIDGKDETSNPKYNGSVTLDILGLFQDQTLILEEQIRGPAGGEYMSDAQRKSKKNENVKTSTETASGRTTPAPSDRITRGRARRDGRVRGSIGLINLGNTCYMNSALQCISRIEELAIYFLDNKYKKEINTDNPLGYNGRMAKAYGDLLSNLYSETASSAFSPRNFKGQLSQAQPMFSGYGQQDSQEFLSFLVDALHEDLNRIHKKPYMENPDSDDKRVNDPAYIQELGETYRSNHRARNDSIAMDLFNGFYKNTMVCPSCDKVSVTFDPYSLLTLQLPIENTWQHRIFFVPQQGKPSLHKIDIDKNASVRALKQHFAKKVAGLTPERLFLVETFQNKIYKVFKDGEMVSEVLANDVIGFYEVPRAASNVSTGPKKHAYRSAFSTREEEPPPDMNTPFADSMAVTVVNRCYSGGNWRQHYVPLVIMITREEAKDYDTILRKILGAVSNITSRDFLAEDRPRSTVVDHTQNGAEDSSSVSDVVTQADGRVSDTSLPSEDEYVNISTHSEASKQVQAAGSSATNDLPEVLRPGNFIPPALRSLFDMKYFRMNEGEFNTVQSIGQDLPLISERVKQMQSRRASVASTKSNQSLASDASTSSGPEQESSVSEEGGSLPDPDLLTRGGSRQGFHGDVQSEEDDALAPALNSKFGRKKKYENKRRHKKVVTYGRKGRRNSKPSFKPSASRVSDASQEPDSDDNPYYIKLGEGITLEWTDQAWDALFGGDPREPHDMRGYETLNEAFLDAVQDPELEATVAKRQRRKKEGVSLEDCFAETAKTETLSEENAWYCNQCKELRRADKTLALWTIPDILVVHLKRFSGERYRRDKVDVLIDFPLEGLDLTERVGHKEDGKEWIYDLFAVDNHYGGLGGGHYTAMAKNFFDGNWYDFNDSFVSKHNPSAVVTPAAYLLFYRRRSATPLGPPYLRDLVQKARDPASTEVSSDSESGEGRLGGPLSSHLHGSSSAGVKAGVGLAAANRPRGGGSGEESDRNPSARPRTGSDADDDEGVSMESDDTARIGRIGGKMLHGPVRPEHLGGPKGGVFGGGGADWSFSGLQALGGGADGQDDGDTASDVPMQGSEAGSAGYRDRMDDFGSGQPGTPEPGYDRHDLFHDPEEDNFYSESGTPNDSGSDEHSPKAVDVEVDEIERV